MFNKIFLQQRHGKQKIYSVHEPDEQCISKGKENKKYEYGSKALIITTKNSGVIIGAINIPRNVFDGHTLKPALIQQKRLTGHKLKNNFVDRGYRSVKGVMGTKIIVADNKKNKNGISETDITKWISPESSNRAQNLTSEVGSQIKSKLLQRNIW